MALGSFVAGSTPLGGGAVAFPVFTKILEVPAAVARTFSLSIQAVGMGTAAATILITKRPVSSIAILVCGVTGTCGFLVALFAFGSPSTMFWTYTIPSEYVKVTFTVILAATAYIVWLSGRRGHLAERLPLPNVRVLVGLSAFGFAGGIAAALIGSGVNVFLFLFVVVLVGIHPRIGVPSAVVAMSIISLVGLLVLGLIHGQLSVDVLGETVTSVGGRAVTPPLPMNQYDLYGLWLAAVPVVAWGAPLGAWVVHRLSKRSIELFIAFIASLEVATTALFLPQLRTDPLLAGYSVAALGLALVGVALFERHRQRILRLAPAVVVE